MLGQSLFFFRYLLQAGALIKTAESIERNTLYEEERNLLPFGSKVFVKIFKSHSMAVKKLFSDSNPVC